MGKYVVNIPCGPIWNVQDAEEKCPIVCAAHLGKWTGQWHTVVNGKMSVCECEFDTDVKASSEIVVDVVAGPIWNNEDAKKKCPVVCASYGGEWTGEWVTPQETFGKMSTCKCRFKF